MYGSGTGGANGAFSFSSTCALTTGGNIGTFNVLQGTFTGTTTGTYSAMQNRAYSQATGLSGGSLIGSTFEARLFSGATGTLGELNSLRCNINNASSATATSSEGLYVTSALNSGGGAITTVYGIKIDNQTVGGTNYAIYTGSGTVRFGDVVQTASAQESTGAGSALLAANCPAVTVTAPYKWIKGLTSDGSTVYWPVWK